MSAGVGFYRVAVVKKDGSKDVEMVKKVFDCPAPSRKVEKVFCFLYGAVACTIVKTEE